MTDAREPQSFAAKLRHLIETMHPADREPYSYREISMGIAERGGPAISGAYINQLANGRRDNPSLAATQALADFFGVPPNYFFDDAITERIDGQLEDIVRWRDNEARATAERIQRLNPRDRHTVTSLIESLEQYASESPERRKRRKPSSGEA